MSDAQRRCGLDHGDKRTKAFRPSFTFTFVAFRKVALGEFFINGQHCLDRWEWEDTSEKEHPVYALCS